MLRKIFIIFAFFQFSIAANASVTEWIDFEIKNNSVQFGAVINGVKASAVIDPTSKVNMLSESFAGANQQTVERSGYTQFKDIKGERNLAKFKKVDIELFGANITFDDLLADKDLRADLVLGIPFFRQYIVQIDFPRNRLRLIDRKGNDIKKIANAEMREQVDAYVTSNFSVDNLKSNEQTSRVVKVKLNGHEQWLTLDFLSAFGVVSSRESALKVGGLTTPLVDKTAVPAQQLTNPAEYYQISSFTIGPFELEGVLLAVEPENGKRLLPTYRRGSKTGTNIDKKIVPDGTLGLDVLKHFVVTFDYSSSQIAFHAE